MPRGEIDLPRLAALSDGVFAVAMTVLVAALPFAPHVQQPDARAISDAMLAMLPQVRAAGISFFVAALYWWRHHDMLATLARGDAVFAGLNFLLLFGVVLMPVATRLLGEFPANAVTVDLYAGTLAFIGAALLAMWRYARRRGLLRPDGARRARRAAFGLGTSVAIFLLCMALAWRSPDAALWSLLLLILAPWLGRRSAEQS